MNRKNWKGVRYTKGIMKRDFCSRTLNQVIIEHYIYYKNNDNDKIIMIITIVITEIQLY